MRPADPSRVTIACYRTVPSPAAVLSDLAFRYTDESYKVDIERLGWRYGAFELAIEIPDRYERKWSKCKLKHGVMSISFPVDEDEEDVPCG